MRKKTTVITALLVVLTLAGLAPLSCNQQQGKGHSPEQAIADMVLTQVDALDSFVKDSLQTAVADKQVDPKRVQRLFLKARLLFKKFEWAAEYFMGATTLMVNGPPVQTVDNADLLDPVLARAYDPTGLQVIEEDLFPQYDTTKRKKLLQQLNLLQSDIQYYKNYFSGHSLSDWRILDAAKLEVFRILTLGIVGYDNPLTLNSMNECAASLESLEKVLSYYSPDDSVLLLQLNGAVKYLRRHTDFDSFDRAKFIIDYGNKISTGIEKLQQSLKSPKIKYNRMLNQEVKTLFDSGAFNVNAFAPGPDYFVTKARIRLGKKLFFDASLSGTGTRSCASCHLPDKAFTDGLIKNANIHNGKPLLRNTPTLLNAALQSNLFYDMRALTLEDQARDVIQNKEEMEGSLSEIAGYLSQDTAYKKLFSEAYPTNRESVIDTFEVMNALASYVRSLTRLNSRFDQYMRGDSTALNKQEIKGFNLFMGKAKCATCHFMPLFNGMTPPKYIESETEVIGVLESLRDTVIDPDLGWYDIIGVPSYKHAFKIPTIRNISKTAPYMHNGVYPTLEEVMEFYNNGGGTGLGLKLDNQTLPEDSLHLTDKEKGEVIAFMKSLDSQ